MQKLRLTILLLLWNWCAVAQPAGYRLTRQMTQAGPTWVFIDSASKTNEVNATSTVTTGNTNTTGANLLIVVVSDFPDFSSLGTVTDNKGNTYSTAVTVATAHVRTTIFYSYSGTVGSNHTFTYTTSGASYPAIYAHAYSGSASSPLDQTNSNSTTVSGTTLSANSVTPTQSNELIVTAMCGYPGQTQPTISGGGFTNAMRMSWRPYSPNKYGNSAVAIQIQTSASTSNPSWAYSTNTQTGVVIASFKNQ